jgi:hypothetical protein
MTLVALGSALALSGGCIWCAAGTSAAIIATITVGVMCLAVHETKPRSDGA